MFTPVRLFSVDRSDSINRVMYVVSNGSYTVPFGDDRLVYITPAIFVVSVGIPSLSSPNPPSFSAVAFTVPIPTIVLSRGFTVRLWASGEEQ